MAAKAKAKAPPEGGPNPLDPPGGQLAAQNELVVQLLQQNQQLMQQLLAQQQAPQPKAAPPPPPLQEQVVRPVPPAEFSGVGFEAWKKRLGDWRSTHARLAVDQKAGLLMQALKGDAERLARTVVKEHELPNPDSFAKIVAALETHYGLKSGQVRMFLKFKELNQVTNTGGNTEVFLRKFALAASEMADEGLEFPDQLNAFLVLDKANLAEEQVIQVLTSAEQMAPGEPVKLKNVESILRGIAQAKHLRGASSRRPRVGLTALDAELEENDENEEHEDSDDGEYDSDPEVDESPDFIAAVAQLRKEFKNKAKKEKKGGKKGRGRGGNGKKKGPSGGGGNASENCKFTGLDEAGDPKCFNLRDNKKCSKKHPPEDLEKARAALKKKGLVPCFNAFDASSGNGFESITRALGSAGITDTGAKKSVCGDRMLGRHLKNLRCSGLHSLVQELPRPSNQTFQFGGGTKTAIRRLKTPFCIRLQLGDARTSAVPGQPPPRELFKGDLSRALRAGEVYTSLSPCGKYEDIWGYIVVSVVPGWLPFLLGYDSQKHHRLATMPELGGMYYRTDGLNFTRVENAFECDKTGVLAFELLPGETDRAQASQALDTHIQLLSQVKSDFQETKETTEVLAQDAAELAHSDVLTEDPSHAASGDHWDAWLQSAQPDPPESKSATCCVVTTPATSVDRPVAETTISTEAHEEVLPERAVALVNARADVPVASAPLAPPDEPNTSPLEPSLDPLEAATDCQKNKKKKKRRRCKEAKRPPTSSAASAPGVERQPEEPNTVEDKHDDEAPMRRAVAAAIGARPPTERAKVRQDWKSCHENEERTFAYLSKPVQKPVTRERLQKLHTLTKCTLSVSALRKLLQRANVPNIREALSWYKEIVESCPNQCGLAEYIHRHRLPRLHMTDMPFNQEIEMDLFKLLGQWHLIIVDRGTRWVEVTRLANKEAATVRDATLRIWVYRHGAPARSVSDCGGEFLSVEFIKEMDTFGIFKEVTPAYASDRHALVERFVRTYREAAERATRKRRRLTYSELDLLTAIITCEANNELQAGGTSASLRTHGRMTTPFISLLGNDQPPTETTARQQLAADAREAWRDACNDRAFQALLRKQLGPQAAGQRPPEPGSLVYYRRPADNKDGLVYRGPAEVLATSSRMEGAFLSHGGLLIRAALEDLIPHSSAPAATSKQAAPSGAPPPTPLDQIPEEELDPRDDDADAVPPTIIVRPPLFPLGPGNLPGYGASAQQQPGLSADTLAATSPETAAAQNVPALLPSPASTPSPAAAPEEPAEISTPAPTPPSAAAHHEPADVSPNESDLVAELFGDDVTENSPAHPVDTVPVDLDDWYGDASPGATAAASSPPYVPPDVVHHEFADDHLPVLVPEPGTPEPELLPGPDPEPSDPVLRPGDRIHVASTRSFTSGGRPRWYVAEVFEQLPDGRTSVRWETKPTIAQAGGVSTPDFETMDLRNRPWRPLRSLSTRLAGDAAQDDTLETVLAAIAALESRLSAGGGESKQPVERTAEFEQPIEREKPVESKAARSQTQARSILTALLASVPLRTNALPVIEEIDTPTSLPHAAIQALEELEQKLTDENTPDVASLERIGAAIADSLHSYLDEAMFGFLGKPCLHCTSDATALATLRELGMRWAPPDDSTWQNALLSCSRQLKTQSNNEELQIASAGELIAIIEHGMAKLQGLETATIAAVAAEGVAAEKAAVLETAVYEYDESDLTEEMKMDAARAELGAYEKYEVWGSAPTAEKDIPESATVIDAKFFTKPKVKKGQLIAKGRLAPRGCFDPERFDHRNDSPAVSKTTLIAFLVMVLSFGWHVGKGDISAAFLQGDPLDREIWVELPKNLIAMGLVDSVRRFRKLAKGAYGLNQAPRLWFLRISKFLCSLGFVQSLIDPCLFVLMRGGTVVALCALYVDDLLVGGSVEIVREIFAALDAQFGIGDPELSSEVKKMSYTGKDITFHRDESGKLTEIHIDQKAYIDAKIGKSIPDFEPAGRSAQEPLRPRECDTYRELQGKLAWVGNTRMDIAVDVSEGASASHAPTVADMRRNVKLAKHVVATSSRAIVLRPIDLAHMCLVLFADGSFANEGQRTRGGHLVCLADRRSIGQGVAALASLLAWTSQTLKRVCTSTFDSECLSTLRGSDDLTALGFLLTEMRYGRMPSILEKALMCGFGSREVPKPLVDMFAYNDGCGLVDAIHTTKWQQQSRRRRIDLASLRESSEFITFAHCSTSKMVADGLTKREEKLRAALISAMEGRVSFP